VVSGELQNASYPDGLSAGHGPEAKLPSLLSRLFPTLLLGAVVGASFTGIYGGLKNPERRAEGNGAALTINAPSVLRNGEFFEMRFRIEADAPIQDATLAIDETYLHDITVNTMIPQAEKEEAKDGTFSFSYGPLAPGERIDVKLDGQINPALFAGTEGAVAVLDGETELARLPMQLTVLP
jgi:hypothetical protein